MAAADPKIKRLPVHWETYVNAVLVLLLLPTSAVLLVRGINERSLVPGLIGVVLGLASLPLLMSVGRELLFRPTLRTHTLVLPWGITGARHLDLADVSGLGLLYDTGGPRSAWVLWVWMMDGNSYPLDSVRAFTRGHKVTNQQPAPAHIPKRRRPRLDWSTLSRTGAGRTAFVIEHQAQIVQGPSGPLTTRRDERGAAFLGSYLAYWSPDGSMGWLDD